MRPKKYKLIFFKFFFPKVCSDFFLKSQLCLIFLLFFFKKSVLTDLFNFILKKVNHVIIINISQSFMTDWDKIKVIIDWLITCLTGLFVTWGTTLIKTIVPVPLSYKDNSLQDHGLRNQGTETMVLKPYMTMVQINKFLIYITKIYNLLNHLILNKITFMFFFLNFIFKFFFFDLYLIAYTLFLRFQII